MQKMVYEKAIKDRLKMFSNLSRYVKHFEKTEGGNEKDSYLPYVVIWFRELLDKAGYEDDAPEVFGFDEDETEEFYSWGHNSRWNHVFATWLESNMDFALETAFDLIDGDKSLYDFDPNIEELVKQSEEERKSL